MTSILACYGTGEGQTATNADRIVNVFAGRGHDATAIDVVDETGWHPVRIGQFGGALRYSEYGFLKRLLMKRIAKRRRAARARRVGVR